MAVEPEPIIIVSEPILIIPEKAYKSEVEFGEFLLRQGISRKAVDILKDQEIDGQAFLKMTEEKYEKIGISQGSIIKLIDLKSQISGFSMQNPSPLHDMTNELHNSSSSTGKSPDTSLDPNLRNGSPGENESSNTSDENSQYTQVYPVRDWVSKTVVKGKKMSYLVDILDNGVFSRTDRNNALLGIMQNFIKFHPKGCYPYAADKIQLALDIIHQFPKMRDSTELGYEYLYDPISCVGLIQDRFKTLRVGLPQDEKKRTRTPKSARKSGAQTSSETSNAQSEISREPSIDQSDIRMEASGSGSNIVAEERATLSDEEYESYVKELQGLTPNVNNKTRILELMDKTRERRQVEIRKPPEESATNQIKTLDKFPRFLDFDGEVLIREYATCYQCGDFKEKFKSYAPKVLKYCQKAYPEIWAKISSFSKEDHLNAIIALSEIIPLSKTKNSSKSPKLEKPCPNPNLLVIDHESDDSLVMNLQIQNAKGVSKQPFIKCNLRDGEPLNYRLLIDGKIILIGAGTVLAFELLVKTHYIFHVQFCEQLQNFFIFVTSYFMGVTKPTSSNSCLNISLNNVKI